MQSAKNRWKTALRLLGIAGALALFVGIVVRADLERVGELVAAVGAFGMLLVLLPQGLALSVETFGWKLAIRAFGRGIGFIPLLRVRVATEALTLSLPAGALLGESVKPLLLARHGGLSVNESVAAIVARKYLLVLSQAGYVVVAATLGFGALEAVSQRLVGGPVLSLAPYAASAVLFGIALGTAAWLRRSAVARGMFRLLSKLPSQRLSDWLVRSERAFHETDGTVSTFFRSSFGSRALPALCFAAGWFFETLETYLVLRLLGADVGLLEIAAIEIVVTLVRHVAFVIPAGLGVQDLGYVTGFVALGLPQAASLGAAFVLLKRAKDLAWMALGYALLALEAKRDATEPSARKLRLSAVP